MATRDTRQKLKAAAVRTLAEEGIAGTSARRIAKVAGVNQALVFYHFGSVDDLLIQACREIAHERATVYRDRFAAVTTLAGLVAAARQLLAEEHRLGNITVLAQLLAGAQTRPRLGPPVRANLDLLTMEVRAVLTRILNSTVLAGLIDEGDLAQILSALFIGIEVLDVLGGEDLRSTQQFETLEQIARLATHALTPGVLPARVVRRSLGPKRGADQ